MSKLRLAPKPIEPKPVTSFKSALRARASLIGKRGAGAEASDSAIRSAPLAKMFCTVR